VDSQRGGDNTELDSRGRDARVGFRGKGHQGGLVLGVPTQKSQNGGAVEREKGERFKNKLGDVFLTDVRSKIQVRGGGTGAYEREKDGKEVKSVR